MMCCNELNSLLLLCLDVRFNVELHEKEEERNNVYNVRNGNARGGIGASVDEKVATL
jgi:hypothetical protein